MVPFEESDGLTFLKSLAESYTSSTLEFSKFDSCSKNKEIAFSTKFNYVLNSACQSYLIQKEINNIRELQDHSLHRRKDLLKLKSKLKDNELQNTEYKSLKLEFLREIREIKENQASHYRDLVHYIHKNLEMDMPLKMSDWGFTDDIPKLSFEDGIQFIERQESFTVNIGKQLKKSFNVIVISCKFTEYYSSLNSSSIEALSHKYNLYSNKISASILIVDDKFPSNYGYSKVVKRESNRTTECHFSQLGVQLDNISGYLKDIQHTLVSGDSYVTLHSNLAHFHTLFHLVVNPSDLKIINHFSSLPMLDGLKSIIKECLNKGCGNIDIPILLLPTINIQNPETNENWCLKRAEAVLKFVKGCISNHSLCQPDKEIPNIRFLVSRRVPVSVYNRILTLIPNVFAVKDLLL